MRLRLRIFLFRHRLFALLQGFNRLAHRSQIRGFVHVTLFVKRQARHRLIVHARFVAGGLQAFIAHRMRRKHHFNRGRLMIGKADQHFHQADHAFGIVARFRHVFHAERVGLAFIVAAVMR